MRKIAANAIFFALFAILLSSCAIQRPVIEYRDSVRVEYRDRIVRDTVPYAVPVEVEKVVTRDTSSRLENSLAVSEAVVSGGYLRHELRTKSQTIQVPVAVEVRDTVYVEKEGQILTQTVEVEKSLTFWQRFKIGAFFWLLVLALIGWRREILALIRKLI